MKKQMVSSYVTLPVIRKTYENIDTATRLELRNEYLEKIFKKNQSDSEQK